MTFREHVSLPETDVDRILPGSDWPHSPAGQFGQNGRQAELEQYEVDAFYTSAGNDPFDVLGPFGRWWSWARQYRFQHLGQPMQTAPTTEVAIAKTCRGEQFTVLINLASYNYLGLATRPEVIEAAIDAVSRYGLGAAGAPLLSGNFRMHEAFAAKLAAFSGKQSALLFPTGYAANLGAIAGLMRPGDLVVADRYAHASIIDGITLSNAKVRFFRHNDPRSLERKLRKHDGKKLVIVEGVYSMDGDIANLPEIVSVARRYGARLMLDEAHSAFLYGARGRGIAEHFGVEDAIDIHVGTLSKSLAGVGGYVAGSADLIEYLRVFARPQFFSCSLPPAIVAGMLRGLEIVETEPDLRERLFSNADFLRTRLKSAGVDLGDSSSHIIPVFIRDDRKITTIVDELIQAGVYLHPIHYPAVPKDSSRLRIFLSASHELNQLEQAADIIIRVLRKHGLC